MEEPARRTRSQAAPEWTLEESILLVNEISNVEHEWGDTLSSFQKWETIAENLHFHTKMNRGLNQCRQKWESLLSDYQNPHIQLPPELFTAIDTHHHLKPTDPDSDQYPEPEPEPDPEPVFNFVTQWGSNSARRSSKTRAKKTECLDENTRLREEVLVGKLIENADLINATLGVVEQDVEYEFVGGKEDMSGVRSANVVVCLANIADALQELANLVQVEQDS